MSFLGWIKRSTFYLKDILTNNGRIYYQIREIKKHLHDNDISFAESKFSEIKEYAIKNTEFYSKYSIDDKFPVMTKYDYLSKGYDVFMSNSYEKPLHISSTSGSTGNPFSVRQDNLKRNRLLADLKVFGELADYPSHEKMIYFRVYNKKRSKFKEWAEGIYYINFSLLGDKAAKKFCDDILRIKPRIVFSYASVLEDIVTYLERHPEVDMHKAKVKCFLMSGESIEKYVVDLIRKHFNCPTFRRYANMEMGILGQDTGIYNEYMLNWSSCYFECLKINSDEPTKEGEVGRIVITDLFNKAMPMIRYDTGDLGIMDRVHYKQPRIMQITGRHNDIIYTVDGKKLDPVNISVGMWNIPNIYQWQFIQHGINDYEMKIVPKEDYTKEETLQRMRNILGKNANIYITLTDEIPVLKSWKRRAVMCEYKPE